MDTNQTKRKDVGALWKYASDRGEYFSGNIEIDGKKVYINVYTNDYKKEGSKEPDFRIFPSLPKGATNAPSPQPAAKAAAPKPKRVTPAPAAHEFADDTSID